MIRNHILPLIAGLALLGLSLWMLPGAEAQTVSIPIGAALEIPPQLSALPVIGDFIQGLQKWLPLIFQLVGAAAILASMTANQTDDKVVNWALKIINLAGFNFGTAKNDASVGVTRPPDAGGGK